MRPLVFVDTSYVLALVNTADQYHMRARRATSQVTPPFVTTEAVLIEVGNALARQQGRPLGIAALHSLRGAMDIEIVPVDPALFDRAVTLYISRPDKEWGLTDCISFVVMQDRGLTQALTIDHHFEQAGFQIVM